VLCGFFARCSSESLGRLQDLEVHTESKDYVAGRMADEVAAIAARLGCLPEANREADFARFLRVIAVNAHTIPRVNGIMFFYWLSMLSHSCSPNATYSTEVSGENVVATARALRHIEEGEVICMSYLPLQLLLASTIARREVLRVQKNFLCVCERCCEADNTRSLPCPVCPELCSHDPQKKQGAFQDEWSCGGCGERHCEDKMPLEQEEKLFRFLLTFEDMDDEQTCHSLTSVVDQDLGGREGKPSEHFLRAWLLLRLFHLVLQKAHGASKAKNALRASAVLHKLHTWTRRHVPSCSHLLALECSVPLVHALLESGLDEQAANVAALFEVALAACSGPLHEDVKVFGRTRSQRAHEAAMDGWLFCCETCGARLRAQGRSPGEDIAGEALPFVSWCSRCGLAAYCGAECEAAGRKYHVEVCVSSEGASS